MIFTSITGVFYVQNLSESINWGERGGASTSFRYGIGRNAHIRAGFIYILVYRIILEVGFMLANTVVLG